MTLIWLWYDFNMTLVWLQRALDWSNFVKFHFLVKIKQMNKTAYLPSNSCSKVRKRPIKDWRSLLSSSHNLLASSNWFVSWILVFCNAEILASNSSNCRNNSAKKGSIVIDTIFWRCTAHLEKNHTCSDITHCYFRIF